MKTIQQVLDELDAIIKQSTQEQSAHGFFATLYRQVTADVAKGIESNVFEDNPRMERLDVIFAQRYLDAYTDFSNQSQCSDSWQVAFKAIQQRDCIILQHLLLGINAHINLDLGIAASETVGDESLTPLRADFNRINELLAARIDESQELISRRSWLFKWVDRWMKRNDEFIAKFSIDVAREGAWSFAQEVHNSNNREQTILQRDKQIADLGIKIHRPGKRIQWALKFVRWTENQSMPWTQ